MVAKSGCGVAKSVCMVAKNGCGVNTSGYCMAKSVCIGSKEWAWRC
jgi:hypothetical protein